MDTKRASASMSVDALDSATAAATAAVGGALSDGGGSGPFPASSFANGTSAILERCLEGAQNAHDKAYNTAMTNIDALLSVLQQSGGGVSTAPALAAATKNLVQKKKLMSRVFKAAHTSVATLLEKLNKYAASDDDIINALSPSIEDGFVGSDVDTVLLNTFLRDGRFGVAEEFAKEAHCQVPSGHATADLNAMHTALHALREGDVSLCLKWVSAWTAFHTKDAAMAPFGKSAEKEKQYTFASNVQTMEERASRLEFDLHRLQYLQLMLRGTCEQDPKPERDNGTAEDVFDPDAECEFDGDTVAMMVGQSWSAARSITSSAVSHDSAPGRSSASFSHPALMYASKHFPKFSGTCFAEIGQLMGAFLYADNMKRSPYAHLVSVVPAVSPMAGYQKLVPATHLWDDVVRNFQHFAWCGMNMPVVDPLSLAVSASYAFMPKSIQVASLLRATASGEAVGGAFKVDLNPKFQHHSTFVCPITRTATTPANPPVLLLCGHVISSSAMREVSLTSRSSRFKCPTCPREQTPKDVLVLKV